MKNILFILMMSGYGLTVNAQTLNSNLWCINGMQTNIDSNGHYTMNIDLYNNDLSLDSDYYYIAIEGLISGNDTIKPINYPYPYFSFTNSDTLESYFIDTAIASNLITGILVRKGIPSCGILILEAINVNKTCGEQVPLDVSNTPSPVVKVYPNPASTILNIEVKNSNFGHKSMDIGLTNSFGQIVLKTKQYPPASGLLQLEISSLANGIYLLTIDGQVTQKIIIK